MANRLTILSRKMRVPMRPITPRGKRARKPQSLRPYTGRNLGMRTPWPPDMAQEDVERAIDAVCGCAGKYDCNCTSVFNKARSDAWFRYNTKGKTQ